MTTIPDGALPAFVDLVREITDHAAGGGPLPRGWRHLGLDHVGLASLDQLAGLARHGIFRKYEQVLFIEGGLGAPARWAAAQLGCTAITTTRSRAEAMLGGAMTAAAGLGDAVSHLAGCAARLPLRDGAVTHVWAFEALGEAGEPGALLAEARRVVRPGGYFAAVEPASDGAPLEVAGRVVPSAATWAARVAAAGFVEVGCAPIDDGSDQVSARAAAARTQLLARLARGGPSLAPVAERIRALTSARDSSGVRTVRVVGRRP
jgi:hypothetical protein